MHVSWSSHLSMEEREVAGEGGEIGEKEVCICVVLTCHRNKRRRKICDLPVSVVRFLFYFILYVCFFYCLQ